MRDYSKVSPQIWTGPTGKALRAAGRDAQVISLYLVSCPSANMIGLYYLPLPILRHETGIPSEGASKALRRVSGTGFAQYDDETETVWVPEMARFQIGDTLKPGDLRIKGIVRELATVRKCKFSREFYEKYRVPFNLPELSWWDDEMESHGSPFEAPSKPLRSQEQEQEQKEPTTLSAPGAPEAAEVSTTPEQHAKEELRWGTPEALVALYHELTKLPRVTLALSPARTTKAKDYLKKFPDREFWVGAFTEISRSTFLSGRRRDPGHEHFKVDFDWLLTKGKADQIENVMKVYEGKYRDAAAPGVEMRHIWSCTVCGTTHKGTEAQYQAKVCLKGVA